MGLLGTSAQAFTDNFLKTYMAIGEDRRAEASQKIAQEMAQAKLKEIADEQAMRAKLTQYNQGLMNNPVMGEVQAPVQQFTPSMTFGQGVQGDKGLLGLPTQQTYKNQYEAWQAEGKDPQREALLGQADIMSSFNPEKGLAIKASLANTEERVQAQREIANIRAQAQTEALKERFKQAIALLSQKHDYASELQKKALEVQLLKIENAQRKQSETDPYKQQTSDARAQQMAMRDLKAEGYTMDMVGNWTLDGQPVKSSMILPKYQALVRQYKVGNVREVAPSSNASSYIKGILKK
jgi:hypothetical protein